MNNVNINQRQTVHTTQQHEETENRQLTENRMFFLSWLTARGSRTGSACLITETLSP